MTFITFIVSEKIATLKVFATLDNDPASWPNTDHCRLTVFMSVKNGMTFTGLTDLL